MAHPTHLSQSSIAGETNAASRTTESLGPQADLRGLSIGRLPEYDRRSAGKYNVRATSLGRSALLQLMNRIDHGRRKGRS
jgi:hypothetical protein